MSQQPDDTGMEVVEGQLDTADLEDEKNEGEAGQDGSSSDGDSGPDGAGSGPDADDA